MIFWKKRRESVCALLVFIHTGGKVVEYVGMFFEIVPGCVCVFSPFQKENKH